MNCIKYFQTLSSLDIEDIHPIPRARFFINKLLFSTATYELLEEIKYWCDYEIKNKKSEPPYFHIWIMEGLIMIHQYDFVIQLSNSIKDDANFQDNRINRGLIQRAKTYEAFALIKTDQIKKGLKIYRQIDTNEYNLFSYEYDKLFYLALTFNISNDIKVKMQGQERAIKLGYQKLFQILLED